MRALALAAFLLAGASPPVVPWLDRRPVEPPANPPLAQPCRAADLRAELVVGATAGQFYGGVYLTNAARRPCALLGRPRASFVGATSRWRVEAMPRQPQPHPVLAGPPGSLRALGPGRTAEVALQWSNWCGRGATRGGGAPGRLPRALELALPGGTSVAEKVAQAPPCYRPAARSVLSVAPFAPALPHLPESSYLPFLATVVAPRPVLVKPGDRALRVHPGELVHYVVVLENTSSRPFRFRGPCPVYVQSFGSAPEQPYVLNCRSVGAIAPSASVRFAMRIRVPEDAPSGFSAIGWTLAPATYDAPQTAASAVVVP